MNCSEFNPKDYLFGELRTDERAQVEQHVAACVSCREELNALNLTRAALASLADEEPPRRIAFVSDQVFEPRWWQKLWHSGPQLGFASAAMLSVALLVHSFVPRAVPTAPATAVAAESVPTTSAASDADLAARIEAAVAQAVARSQQEQAARVLAVVDARLKLSEREHREDLLLVREYLERVQKGQQMIRRAAYEKDFQ